MQDHSKSISSVQGFNGGPRASVLLVMDEALIALELESELQDAGFSPVGPMTTCAGAHAWLAGHAAPTAAIVSYQLADGDCSAVLDDLARSGVPILLFTALPPSSLPSRFHHMPRLEKPALPKSMAGALAALLAKSGGLGTDHQGSAG